MDNTDDTLLEQFLRGELSEKKVVALQVRLANEPQLASTLSELQNLQDGIRYHRLQEKLTEIQSWEIDIANESPTDPFEADVNQAIRFNKQKELLAEIKGFELADAEVPNATDSKRQLGRAWWAIAAGVAILLSAVCFFWDGSSEKSMTNEELFAAYFEPYPAIGIKRGNTSTGLKTKAFNFYKTEDYQSAAPLFKELYIADQDTLSHFYYAISLLGNQQFEEAIINLKQVKAENSILAEQVNWYLFLAYLGKKEKFEIDQLIDTLPLGKKKDDAKNILELLEQKK